MWKDTIIRLVILIAYVGIVIFGFSKLAQTYPKVLETWSIIFIGVFALGCLGVIYEWFDSLTDQEVNVYFIWIPSLIIAAFLTFVVFDVKGTFEGIVVGSLFIIIIILIRIFSKLRNKQ
jgi:hypothetical protein